MAGAMSHIPTRTDFHVDERLAKDVTCMIKLIAVRKRSRIPELALSSMSVRQKRAAVMERAMRASPSVELLQALGLESILPEDCIHDTDDTFQRLCYVGAYVIQTHDREVAERARAILLASDHWVVPDVDVLMPLPKIGEQRSRATRAPVEWPEASGIPLARSQNNFGKGVLMGVLDSGCDADHAEFRGRPIDFCYVPLAAIHESVRAVRGFDVHGHGTNVCGVIAGKNVGVAPGVDLMVAGIIESESIKTSLDRVLVGLNWMLSKFKIDDNLDKPTIINMSLGFALEADVQPELHAAIVAFRTALETMVTDFDVLPIAAIGNDGPGKQRLPGQFPEALSVGAVDVALQPAWFSGGGLSELTHEIEPDIAGYGVNLTTSQERTPRNRSLYTQASGTSIAAPYVAGIAALCASADPQLQGNALRRHLLQNALRLDAAPDRVGAGLARYV